MFPSILIWGGGAGLFMLLSTPLIRRLAVAQGWVSHPSNDRWGRRVIARLGGVPLALSFLAAIASQIPQDKTLIGLALAGILMLGIGMVDDIRRLSPYAKLVAQIIAACAVPLCGIQVSLPVPWLETPVTIGWLILMMNAFNLIDNMDGLAAGIGAIAAFFCVWHAAAVGQADVAVIAAAIGGSALAFLRFNLPPAKVFLGDSGSQVLGLGLGALALAGTWQQSTRLVGILALPSLLLAVPIFDTLFVTLQRMTHGRSPFQGGTDHLSHRMSILGLTTRQVVFTLYGISIGFGLLSVAMTRQLPLTIAGVWLLAVGGFLIFGIYLGKVRVYTGPAGWTPHPQERVTLIQTMLLHKRRIVEVGIDFTMICAAYVFAHLLRYEGGLTAETQQLIGRTLPLVIGVKMLCFFSCGLYRGIWRYTGIPDLVNILRAVLLGSVFSAIAVLMLWKFEGYSRTTFVIDALLLFILIGGVRVTERLLDEWILLSTGQSRAILVIGAGDTGAMLSRQVKQMPQSRRKIVGFLDDDPAKRGSQIHGVRILGPRQMLGRLLHERSVQEVWIAIRRPPADLVRHVQITCEEHALPWRMANTLLPDEQAFLQDPP